ncbi:MAG TPA: ribonuclease HII, partial [Flavobacterium sp.]|nr:ribonuclease HII [Flavobacterium sp.]
ILNASILAMHLAVQKLSILPQFLLIDGNRFKHYPDIPHSCIIDGDAKYKNIAAASVLAKTYRDDFMNELHHSFPYYGWDTNKGYCTQYHREQIKIHGECHYHRQSFRLLPELNQPELFD